MTSTKLLALVKWIGGPDDKKYTVGIPVEWIKGFDLAEFQSEKFDASLSYVIEWRDKRKEPAGGWAVFDAYVIDVSSRIRILENKLIALDGLLSPTKIVKPVSTLEAQEQVGNNAATAVNFSDRNINNGKTTPSPNNTTIPTNSVDSNDDQFPERNQRNIVKLISAKSGKNYKLGQDKENRFTNDNSKAGTSGLQKYNQRRLFAETEDSDDGNDRFESVSEISGCMTLKSKQSNRKLYTAASGNAAIESTLVDIKDELKKIRRRQLKRHAEDYYSSESSDEEMVEVGPRGSGISITSDQWKAAKASRSYTAIGLNLLLSLFPMNVLIHSNLRGGSTKIRKLQDNAQKYQALDKQTLDALYYTVRKHWKTYDKTGLGTAINNKLTHLRAVQKKRVAEVPDIVE